MNFLDGDRLRGSGVDDARIVLDRHELSLIVEDIPILLDKAVNTVTDRCREVGQVEFPTKLRAVDGFIVGSKKRGVDIVEGWCRMLAPTKDRSAINVAEDDVKVMRLIGESTIVLENVPTLLAAHAGGNPDGFR